jgi:serine/threonine protein kinase
MTSTYGPWSITDEVLYEKKDVRIIGTTDREYVLKVRKISSTAHDELGALCMIRRHSLTYAIYTPRAPHKFCGMTDTHIWFAMRRYAGHINYDDYARRNWLRIAQDVLAFLTQLHRACHLIHMDIKITNILCSPPRVAYTVSDYELCDVPNNRLTRDYDADSRYYYMAMGAQLNEQLCSWRMDLTALGYMLAEITWNKEEQLSTTFQKRIFQRRDEAAAGGLIDSHDDAELIALRESEMRAAHPTVIAYLRLVETLPWNAEAPPPESFYRELLAFFR